MRSDFEYVSDFYYSNCFIESIKAKLRNPHIKVYFCKPVLTPGKFQFIHFMWDDGKASYDFSDCEEDNLPLWKVFFFKGKIRKFKKGFAKRYSESRNRRKGDKSYVFF